MHILALIHLASWYEVVIALIVLIGFLVQTILVIWFIFRKDNRILSNLKKKIYLIKTGDSGLLKELALLKEDKLLFNVYDSILDMDSCLSILNRTNEKFIAVVRYSKNHPVYTSLVLLVCRKNCALIVLAKPDEIDSEDMKLFITCDYFEMCNTVSRLLTLIFNLAIIMPHRKK